MAHVFTIYCEQFSQTYTGDFLQATKHTCLQAPTEIFWMTAKIPASVLLEQELNNLPDGYCSMCWLPCSCSLLGQHYYQMTWVLYFGVYHISFLILIIVALRGIESHMALACYKALQYIMVMSGHLPVSVWFCSHTVQDRSESLFCS